MGDDDISALAGVSRTLRTLADGTVRIQIDFEPRDNHRAMQLFGSPGTPVAMARMRSAEDRPSVSAARQLPAPADQPLYGNEARKLHASGFFRSPHVWRAAGTDAEFLAYLKTCECAARSSACGGDIVPAHVRRLANGSGTGIKPQYSAIPLCNTHHQLQHQHGYSAIMEPRAWDAAVITSLANWSKATIKRDLGHDSLNTIPPSDVLAWCVERDIDRYLPACYRFTEGD